MDIGDRVVWLGALDKDGRSKGGWAGNGRGVIAAYEKQRQHFEGVSPPQRTKEGEYVPSRGPAIGILLDGGDPNAAKKHDVWVRPSKDEIAIDPQPLKEEAA